MSQGVRPGATRSNTNSAVSIGPGTTADAVNDLQALLSMPSEQEQQLIVKEAHGLVNSGETSYKASQDVVSELRNILHRNPTEQEIEAFQKEVAALAGDLRSGVVVLGAHSALSLKIPVASSPIPACVDPTLNSQSAGGIAATGMLFWPMGQNVMGMLQNVLMASYEETNAEALNQMYNLEFTNNERKCLNAFITYAQNYQASHSAGSNSNYVGGADFLQGMDTEELMGLTIAEGGTVSEIPGNTDLTSPAYAGDLLDVKISLGTGDYIFGYNTATTSDGTNTYPPGPQLGNDGSVSANYSSDPNSNQINYANGNLSTTAVTGFLTSGNNQLTSIGGDAQILQLNLQNIAQNQNLLITMISNLSKVYSDNQAAIIRNIHS